MIRTWTMQQLNRWLLNITCILALATFLADLMGLMTVMPPPYGFINEWGRATWLNEIPYLLCLLGIAYFAYHHHLLFLLLVPLVAVQQYMSHLTYIIEYHSYISPMYVPLQLHALLLVLTLSFGLCACCMWVAILLQRT